MPHLKDEKAKDTQSEGQKIRCKDYKNNLRRIWGTTKDPNICLIGVTEENQNIKQLF